MSMMVTRACLFVFLASLSLSPQLIFSKSEPEAVGNAIDRQAVEGEEVPIIFSRPQTGTLPADPSGGCLLSPVQYTFTVPEGECEPVELGYNAFLRANQNVRLYARFGQRVAVEGDRILADYAADSGSAMERNVDISAFSHPALRSGKYFIATANCGPGAADFTLTLIASIADFFEPIRLITRAEVDGKRLLIYGCFPKKGATLFINGERQKHLLPDEERPRGLAVAQKAGARIAPGQTVTIEFRYPDGTQSNTFLFTRPSQ